MPINIKRAIITPDNIRPICLRLIFLFVILLKIDGLIKFKGRKINASKNKRMKKVAIAAFWAVRHAK